MSKHLLIFDVSINQKQITAMRTKHLTLIEVGSDADSPMIGTLLNVEEKQLDVFKSRLTRVLEGHFDADKVKLIQPKKAYEEIFTEEIFTNQFSTEIKVIVNGDFESNIQILETWVY